MAKFYVGKGLEEYLATLGNLETHAEGMIKYAVYPAAGIVADAVRSEIAAIPTRAPRGSDGILADQRRGLYDGLGISSFQNEGGYINVKIGFDGYNDHKTEKYPHGQPNAMIARSINSGTSFSQKYPFVDRAVRKSKKQAEDTMKIQIDGYITAISNN